MIERRHAQPRDFADALEGLDFPASQAAIINKAKDRGGMDAEVSVILEHLTDRTYDSMDDVAAEVEWVYAAMGLPSGDTPAAPDRRTARGREERAGRATLPEGAPGKAGLRPGPN